MKRVAIFCVTLAGVFYVAALRAHDGLPDFSELVEEAAGAVVNVSIMRNVSGGGGIPEGLDFPFPEGEELPDFLKKFFEYHGADPDLPFDTESVGSGFVISKDGYIVTNAHVIDDASEILVKLQDRRELSAEVIGIDKYSDIALLKVSANNLPVVALGKSEDLTAGEWVVAIGSPFGFDHSVTAGIVSAIGRTLPSVNYVSFIQTDVAVNPGNSGGPLFNMQGQVVGINSHIYSRTGGFMGLSFAIPSEFVTHVVEQLKQQGFVTRGWLGVYIQEITRELSESLGLSKPQGVLVSGTTPDSPAALAGIEVGDVIVSFNGKKIENIGVLPPLVGHTKPDQAVPVEVLRNNELLSFDVTIKALPDSEQPETVTASEQEDKRPNVELLGLTVRAMTPDEQAEVEFKENVLVVEEVIAGVARQAGLGKGDLILMINNQRFADVDEFRQIVEELPREQFVIVLIMRDGMTRFLAMKIPADAE